MPRWMPEQRMQTKTPRFHEAHRGSVSVSCSHLGEDLEDGLTLVSLAIGADLVGLQLEQALESCGVGRCALGAGVGRSSRHVGGFGSEQRREGL